jgi:FtsP/CotA-like multicopper oxidase with cupredoxin domain
MNRNQISRRTFVSSAVTAAAGSALLSRVTSNAEQLALADVPTNANAPSGAKSDTDNRYRPVITPNGSTLPWKQIDGVKVYHLIAEEAPRHEFAPGLMANCWGFNGQIHGPTIEAVEGDRVRIYVTNKLPEATSIHWHGLFLPNGMDGVSGLTQKPIQPDETFKYEFTLKQHGTHMYHSHHDGMTQMALGLMGLFVIHPKNPGSPRPDRDFAMMLSEWKIVPGTARPDPVEMTDFNIFTFNAKVFPATAPLVVKRGERVRLRFSNLSAMDHHPIHLHGHRFRVTETDGGQIPESAQQVETTVLVQAGSTRTIDFMADAPGDWPLHCHMSHHTMNQMGHQASSLIGIDKTGLNQKLSKFISGYMTMGENGMGEMGAMGMKAPKNSIPMVGRDGPFDYIAMGGMFTLLKVRDELSNYEDPGWYKHPPGTVADVASDEDLKRDGINAA